MKLRTLALTAMLFGASAAQAQTAAQHVAMGDSAHAALNAATALRHYEAAIAADARHYEALWKAAREAVDLGEFDPNEANRTRMYQNARGWAERAVQANPQDAEGHFVLARAIGRNALTMGARDRVKFAGEVRQHALEALRLNPRHAGALHAMGMWNAEVMRLSGISRTVARTFLGGAVFGEASWANAVRYLQQAVQLEPDRVTHRLQLGRVFADMGDKGKAREQFEAAIRNQSSDFNDARYKQDAERRLRELR